MRHKLRRGLDDRAGVFGVVLGVNARGNGGDQHDTTYGRGNFADVRVNLLHLR